MQLNTPTRRPQQPPLLQRRRAIALPRAQLDGLEMRESTFGEWLAAGGDRRSHMRQERDKSA